MKILYLVGSGLMGGVERHVQCLARCLKDVEQVKVLIIGNEGPIGEAMKNEGIDVEAFGCTSGHDLRIFPKLHRLLKAWQPDVVCPQGLILFPMIYFALIDRRTPVIRSIHTPIRRQSRSERLVGQLLGRRFNYHLPVSSSTWEEFLSVYPWARRRGEVFFNPLYRVDGERIGKVNGTDVFTVGMVGRGADQKDWPCFAAVANLLGGGHDCQEECAPLKLAYDFTDPDIIVAMPACKIDGRESWKDKKEIKKAFKNFGSVVNAHDGTRAVFPASSVGKMLYQSGVDISQIVPSFRYLFEQSLLAWREPEIKMDGHKYHFNVRSYANYVNRLALGGKEYFIRFTLREIGNEYGVHASTISEVLLYRKTNNGTAADSTSENPKDGQTAPSAEIVAQLAGNVNRRSIGFVDYKLEAFLMRDFVQKRFIGVGVGRDAAANLPGMHGEHLDVVEWMGEQTNGREWIRKFDLFVMTSKHEQLPTTVLECFAEGTPICGFIPEGGTTDILKFSKGPIKSVFISERNCEKLAGVVKRIAGDAKFQRELVEDGRQILEGHFDAMKNCRGQLLEIYRKVMRNVK